MRFADIGNMSPEYNKFVNILNARETETLNNFASMVFASRTNRDKVAYFDAPVF